MKREKGLFYMNMEPAMQPFEIVKINDGILALDIPLKVGKELNEEHLYCVRGEDGDYETIEKSTVVDLAAFLIIRPEDIEKLDKEETSIDDIKFTGVMMTITEFMTANFDRSQF